MAGALRLELRTRGFGAAVGIAKTTGIPPCQSACRQPKSFLMLSCIGALHPNGRILAPCWLQSYRIGDGEYQLIVRHDAADARALLFEANLYTEKLFSDTTVESRNPGKNSAFGGAAFLGNTELCGEQWLYSRPDFSKVPEVYDKRICRAVFHMPIFCTAVLLTICSPLSILILMKTAG